MLAPVGMYPAIIQTYLSSMGCTFDGRGSFREKVVMIKVIYRNTKLYLNIPHDIYTKDNKP